MGFEVFKVLKIQTLWFSGMWHRVVWYVCISLSEEYTTVRMQQVTLKPPASTRIHGVKSQKPRTCRRQNGHPRLLSTSL
jgi:hypothetical protein